MLNQTQVWSKSKDPADRPRIPFKTKLEDLTFGLKLGFISGRSVDSFSIS